MKKIQLIGCICCLLGMASSAQAQSWKDLFNKENVSKVVDTVSEVTGTNTIKDLQGTWTYNGSAVEFKSDNLLKKAGGTVAASTAENKLDEQLARVGIKPGLTQFTFNADNTFTSIVGKKTMKGTYTYDRNKSMINLKYNAVVNLNAKVSGTPNNMSLLFDADKLLQLITLLGSKVNNTTIKAITTMAESYDGMLLGLEMKK